MVKTINGLPKDYSGKCHIMMNDINEYVAARNLVFLTMLMDRKGAPPEEAAETVLHLWYSAAITQAQSVQLIECVSHLFAQPASTLKDAYAAGADIALTYHYTPSTMTLLGDMVQSDYDWRKAAEAMRRVTLAPPRLDFRERHLSYLAPFHRVSSMRMRESGILLPFGMPITDFTQPNR